MILTYAALCAAIVLEVLGTTLLQKSEQFTKVLPLIGMAVSYMGSLYFLSLTLKSIPVGLAYATWSALGVVLTSIIGLVLFKQTLDTAAIVGLSFIVTGVVIINLISKSVVH